MNALVLDFLDASPAPALRVLPAAPLPDHDAALTATNSVTISASSIDALPPGRYHYQRFAGLDPLAIAAKPASVENLEDRIEELEASIKKDRLAHEITGEQNGFACDLLGNITAYLRDLNTDGKLTHKALIGYQALFEQSMFEADHPGVTVL